MAVRIQGDVAASCLFILFNVLTIALPASNVGGAFELSIFEIIEALQIQLRFDNGSDPAASDLARSTLALVQFMAACLIIALMCGVAAAGLAYQSDYRGKWYRRPAPWLVAGGVLTVIYPLYIIIDGVPAVFITPLRIDFVGDAAYVGIVAAVVGIAGGGLTWLFPAPDAGVAATMAYNKEDPV